MKVALFTILHRASACLPPVPREPIPRMGKTEREITARGVLRGMYVRSTARR